MALFLGLPGIDALGDFAGFMNSGLSHLGNYTMFEWFHLYLKPVLIMLDVLVVFAIYLQWLGKQHRALA